MSIVSFDICWLNIVEPICKHLNYNWQQTQHQPGKPQGKQEMWQNCRYVAYDRVSMWHLTISELQTYFNGYILRSTLPLISFLFFKSSPVSQTTQTVMNMSESLQLPDRCNETWKGLKITWKFWKGGKLDRNSPSAHGCCHAKSVNLITSRGVC